MLAWDAGSPEGETRTFAAAPVWSRELRGPNTLDELGNVLKKHEKPARYSEADSRDHGPSGRGFIVILSYDLFRQLEPSSANVAMVLVCLFQKAVSRW